MTAKICAPQVSLNGQMFEEVRSLLLPWGFSLLFPLPLMAVDPGAVSSDIITLYVALSLGWLATEVFRNFTASERGVRWRARIGAFVCMACLNALVFIGAGEFNHVRSNMPWPLLVCLATAPAIGLVPWLVLKMKQPQGALVMAALIVGCLKLFGCVMARIVYGPDFLKDGYASADWNTAKLMISCMWTGTLIVAFIAGRAAYRQCVGITEGTHKRR
jgi:hypothetical protein